MDDDDYISTPSDEAIDPSSPALGTATDVTPQSYFGYDGGGAMPDGSGTMRDAGGMMQDEGAAGAMGYAPDGHSGPDGQGTGWGGDEDEGWQGWQGDQSGGQEGEEWQGGQEDMSPPPSLGQTSGKLRLEDLARDGMGHYTKLNDDDSSAGLLRSYDPSVAMGYDLSRPTGSAGAGSEGSGHGADDFGLPDGQYGPDEEYGTEEHPIPTGYWAIDERYGPDGEAPMDETGTPLSHYDPSTGIGYDYWGNPRQVSYDAAAGAAQPGGNVYDSAAANPPAQPDQGAPAGTQNQSGLTPEQAWTQQAIADAQAGKKSYAIGSDGKIQFSKVAPLDSLTQAVQDGVFQSPGDAVWQAATQRQQAIGEAMAGRKPYTFTPDGRFQLSKEIPYTSLQAAVADGVIANPSAATWKIVADKQAACTDLSDYYKQLARNPNFDPVDYYAQNPSVQALTTAREVFKLRAQQPTDWSGTAGAFVKGLPSAVVGQVKGVANAVGNIGTEIVSADGSPAAERAKLENASAIQKGLVEGRDLGVGIWRNAQRLFGKTDSTLSDQEIENRIQSDAAARGFENAASHGDIERDSWLTGQGAMDAQQLADKGFAVRPDVIDSMSYMGNPATALSELTGGLLGPKIARGVTAPILKGAGKAVDALGEAAGKTSGVAPAVSRLLTEAGAEAATGVAGPGQSLLEKGIKGAAQGTVASGVSALPYLAGAQSPQEAAAALSGALGPGVLSGTIHGGLTPNPEGTAANPRSSAGAGDDAAIPRASAPDAAPVTDSPAAAGRTSAADILSGSDNSAAPANQAGATGPAGADSQTGGDNQPASKAFVADRQAPIILPSDTDIGDGRPEIADGGTSSRTPNSELPSPNSDNSSQRSETADPNRTVDPARNPSDPAVSSNTDPGNAASPAPSRGDPAAPVGSGASDDASPGKGSPASYDFDRSSESAPGADGNPRSYTYPGDTPGVQSTVPGAPSGEAGQPGTPERWTPHDGFQMPAADKGQFIGDIGNSPFALSDAMADAMGVPRGTKIPWREGIPDFGDHAVPGPKGLPEAFSVPGMTGDHGADRELMVEWMSQKANMSKSAVKSWLKANKVRLHHVGGDNVQVVPKAVHDLHHSGGAQQLRGGN